MLLTLQIYLCLTCGKTTIKTKKGIKMKIKSNKSIFRIPLLFLCSLFAVCAVNLGFSSATFAAAPTVESVSPASGSTSGGDTITITGTGFLPSPTVTLGGVAIDSSDINLTGSTVMTIVTPAHEAEAVDLVITNTDTTTVTKTDIFTYTDDTVTSPDTSVHMLQLLNPGLTMILGVIASASIIFAVWRRLKSKQ